MVSISTGKGSKQNYSTPDDFMRAVENNFGSIAFDLAAEPETAKAKDFYTIEDNSLEQDWTKLKGILWLNPPFRSIEPWAKKCHETVQKNKNLTILFLVPASVGSNWFAKYCCYYDVFFLTGRLKFDGKNPFPKDCMLIRFDSNFDGWTDSVMQVWDWRKYS